MTAVALLIVAAPAYAAKADGPSEVALHIEAEVAIPPDRAEMTLSGLHAKQTAIIGLLAGAGIGADKVKLLEPVNDETVAVDEAASAIGYHVVRLMRVSDTSPPLNMRDLHTAIGFADGAEMTLQPGYFASAAYATVGMDFVIAPN